MEDIYGDNSIDIHSECFDTDFDDVGWDPEVVDELSLIRERLGGNELSFCLSCHGRSEDFF